MLFLLSLLLLPLPLPLLLKVSSLRSFSLVLLLLLLLLSLRLLLALVLLRLVLLRLLLLAAGEFKMGANGYQNSESISTKSSLHPPCVLLHPPHAAAEAGIGASREGDKAVTSPRSSFSL